MPSFLRAAAFAVVALIAACSQPAAPASDTPAASAPAQAVLDVLTPVVSAQIGKPVALQATTSNVTGDWAYIVAQPRNADGSAIDWSATSMASAHENGAMDDSGAVHALLHKENGVWVVLEHVIGATDVAWENWASAHNVPAGVVDVPAAPAP